MIVSHHSPEGLGLRRSPCRRACLLLAALCRSWKRGIRSELLCCLETGFFPPHSLSQCDSSVQSPELASPSMPVPRPDAGTARGVWEAKRS